MKGSLVDEHTIKGVTKAGKEVCCYFVIIYTLSQSHTGYRMSEYSKKNLISILQNVLIE